MQGSSSQLPERYIAEPSSFPTGEDSGYDARSHYSNGFRPRKSHSRRFGNLLRYPFAAARTQPFLTGILFIFTILIGFTWWIIQPNIWHVEAAIVVATPKSDDFLQLTGDSILSNSPASLDNTIASITSSNLASQGFRYLSPHDVGELLTTPAMVQKAHQQLNLQHSQTARELIKERASLSPVEMLTARAIQFHDTMRHGLSTYFRSIMSGLTGDQDKSKNESAVALQNESSRSINDFLSVELLSPGLNEDHVLRLRITAGQPYLAEDTAAMLVALAKNRLSEFESENSLQHLRDLQPRSNKAKTALIEAQQKLEQYRNTLTIADPNETAVSLAQQLSVLEKTKAQLETETTEAETERLAIINQLDEMRKNGETFVTRQKTAENPRILDINREISELQAKHDSLVDFTEEHPEKKSLREQIERKKKELAALPPTIVVEDIREQNPVFDSLDQRRLGLDRKISQLAGREVGINKEMATVQSNLESVRIQAKKLTVLEDAKDRAEASYGEINEKVVYLLTKIAQSQQFQHIQLMEIPEVQNAITPDEPNLLAFLFGTIGGALLVSLIGPAIRSNIRSRIVTREQVESLACEVPIVIIGEIPDRPMRKLLPIR